MNVYENQILHSSILSFDPVIRKRELNPAGRCRQHIRYIVCRNIAGYDNRSEKA